MKNEQKYILVIDDDPDILDAVSCILEDDGFPVKAITDGAYLEHLATSVQTLPDLIILDVLLSGKDGRTIAKKLKSHEKTRQIPVIMVSAHPDVAPSVKACGADDFLPKPFDVDALLEKVHKFTH